MTYTFFLISIAAIFYVMACLWRDLKSNPNYYLN